MRRMMVGQQTSFMSSPECRELDRNHFKHFSRLKGYLSSAVVSGFMVRRAVLGQQLTAR